MKTFKSITDLKKLLNNPFHDTVKEIISPYIEAPTYRGRLGGLIEPVPGSQLNSSLSTASSRI